jgi:dTDP-4-dehydrorhamnose 3,5-epimerase
MHNESLNIKKYTFRGFHAQTHPFTETKVVRVIHGKIIDMILDLRKYSKTYKKIIKIELNEGKNLLVVARGCAHGYFTLKKNTRLSYLHDNYYSKKHEITINCNDKSICLPIKLSNIKQMSYKDQNGKLISDLECKFNF